MTPERIKRGLFHLTEFLTTRILKIRHRSCCNISNANFHGYPLLLCNGSPGIHIGNKVTIISKSSRTALGIIQKSLLRLSRPGARISIGNETGISGSVIAASISVEIGERCLIGSGCLIVDNDFHQIDNINRRHCPPPTPQFDDAIYIEDDVFIGARSIVLKGVRIGKGSVIGAGSVVTKSIPEYSIAAGNPCLVIRQIENIDL